MTSYIPFALLLILPSEILAVIHRDLPALSPDIDPVNGVESRVAGQQLLKWTDSAFNYLHNLDCQQIFFTTKSECEILVAKEKNDVNVYVAGPSIYGKLKAILPDSGLSRAGTHDAVVVLDPYPEANFGHLILVFFVNLGLTRSICQVEGGTYLGYGECLTLGIKRRCKNALERRRRRKNFYKRCEINFLPTVHLKNGPAVQRQMLECRDDIPGFRPCPVLRSWNETSTILCHHLRDNTRSCDTTQETVQTSCRIYEECDQAVLLSGGWNRQTGLPRHQDNARRMYSTLRQYGFNERNIQVFIANGAEEWESSEGESTTVHAAALKLAMRSHVKMMCASPHCVESLVLYMNSPSRSDGTSLLWDTDADGVASEHEQYPLTELLSDLENCQAKRVIVVVDQSYSGEIARAVRRSDKHKNVAVFASSDDEEYSWLSDYTDTWVDADHARTCVKQVHKRAELSSRNGTHPDSAIPRGDKYDTTIFGSRCDVTPPFTNSELRQKFYGCQNLPTAVWMNKFYQVTDRLPTWQP